MARLGERYPGYGFERHKGYGTQEHKVAVAKLGPTPEHRLTFNVRRLAEAVVAAPARRRKPRRASWRELPAAEMAAHLLETPTIADRAWTDEPRLPRETRTAFIRRVLLGETEPVEAPEGETAATETASAFAARPGTAKRTRLHADPRLAGALPRASRGFPQVFRALVDPRAA